MGERLIFCLLCDLASQIFGKLSTQCHFPTRVALSVRWVTFRTLVGLFGVRLSDKLFALLVLATHCGIALEASIELPSRGRKSCWPARPRPWRPVTLQGRVALPQYPTPHGDGRTSRKMRLIFFASPRATIFNKLSVKGLCGALASSRSSSALKVTVMAVAVKRTHSEGGERINSSINVMSLSLWPRHGFAPQQSRSSRHPF
jgi:hypothetical protein